MKIEDFDTSESVLVIAEIGNNHEGNFEVACELVESAARCGVGAVKFQTFKTERFISRHDSSRFARMKRFELTFPQFEELAKLAHSRGLLFISTPLDLESAEFLLEVVDAVKIASGDNNFYPLISKAANSFKPVIISAGATDLDGLAPAVKMVKAIRSERSPLDLALLQCVSSYPVPMEQANVLSICALRERFNVPVGYSDHTVGRSAARIAVALGARIVEKHFTLRNDYSDFRDHQLSADPVEMKLLVQDIRETEQLLGSSGKQLQPCEKESAQAIRRSIVAGTNLKKGHCVELADLMWIRPGEGLSPGQEDLLVGKCLLKDIQCGDPIRQSEVA